MESAFSSGEVSISEETMENENFGSCFSCGELTSQHCKRCGDYYCSRKCQSSDWPKHRYICFPKPPLVRIRTSIEDDVYSEKHPGTIENKSMILQEFHNMKETIMKELQRLQSNLDSVAGSKNEIKINGLNKTQASSNNNRGLEVMNNSPRSYRSELSISQDSGSVYVSECCTDNVGLQDLATARPSISKSQLVASKNTTDTNEQRVILCTFRSINRCAIRHKNHETDSNFRAITKHIDNYGRNAPQMEILPKVGAFAIALKSNKQYTRVKVIKCENEDKIRVVFCDYGSTVSRKLSELRVITPEISSLPEYVTTVQLYGVQMIKFTDTFADFLKTFKRKEFRIEYMNDIDNNHVKLYDIETGELLNELITKFSSEIEDSSKTTKQRQISHTNTNVSINNNRKTSKSESTFEPEDEKIDAGPTIKPPFKTHIFTAGSTHIKAVVVETNLLEYGYVACVPLHALAHLSKIQYFLSNMEIGKEPYEPKLGEYCIAQYVNKWYRGLVVGTVDDGTKYEVSYIDFLNEETLTSKYIRPYPKDLKIDCFTTLCKFDGLPKILNDKQREFLKSEVNIEDVLLVDRVVEIIEEKVACIECSEIIAGMHTENLI